MVAPGPALIGSARRPASERGDMFRYRLHSPGGDDLGEATYAMQIVPGDEIHGNAGQRLRVVDVVPFKEADELGFVGMLKVEAS
jgi:hypothetical protein